MNLIKRSFYCVLFFLLQQHYNCQINIDSAYVVINKMPEDSNKVIKLIDFGWSIRRSDPGKMLTISRQVYALSEKISFSKGLGRSLSYMGVAHHLLGNSDSAISINNAALKLLEKEKDSTWLISTNKNLGNVWMHKGNFNNAQSCYLKALKISELRHDKKNIAFCYAGIAQVYNFQGNSSKALDCYKRSAMILESLNERASLCNTLNNMSGIYYILRRYKEALQTTQKALAIALELNIEKEKTNSYILLANVYSDMGDNKKAKPFYLKAIEIQKATSDYDGLMISLFNISDVSIAGKNLEEAMQYRFQALEIAKKMENPLRIKEVYEGISDLYSKMGDYKKAFEYQSLLMNLKDTLLNAETNKQLAEMNTKYETEKKDKELIKKDAEIGVQSVRAEKQAAQRNYFIVGFILVGILALFIYRSYHQKNKANVIIEAQKKEVEHQKELVEEKNKEVLDSINYAKRIQRALLASDKLLNTNLNDFFILFNPKDIVSGDFYWAAVLPNNRFGLVTADSTGHGVPGAIMSMLNISCLNEAINRQNLSEPKEILNYSRKKIIEYLANDGSAEGGKDGMDCSLISLDLTNNKMSYAAANNPVWIVRNSSGALEMLEFGPDKMPVGKHDRDSVSFTQHQIELQKGDVIYVLTDGFPDQFGGPKGKKFMYKQLKELLISINSLSMQQQKDKLNAVLADWIKGVEQVDDITIIGIKV